VSDGDESECEGVTTGGESEGVAAGATTVAEPGAVRAVAWGHRRCRAGRRFTVGGGDDWVCRG
jgi:hypothetical protein